MNLEDWRRRSFETLLVTNPFPDLAFGQPLRRTTFDLISRPFEVLACRLSNRNPTPPGWRRREIKQWIQDGPGPGPSGGTLREAPLLFAAVAAWNEDDIIFATVRNLFEQGADRVFVIDDSSDDQTFIEAQAAGATVIPRQSDGRYSELARATAVRDLVARETTAMGGDVWWLIADADEFPRGPDGVTLRDTIVELPDWVDVVGSRVLDHVPDSTSRFNRREHPIEAFRLARLYHNPYCPRGHWKHQLLHVRHARDLAPLPGQHVAVSGDGRRIREASISLLMHHFPLRGYERTAAKFSEASRPGGRYSCSPDAFTRSRLDQRKLELKLHYTDAHSLVPNPYPGNKRLAFGVRHWTEFVSPLERNWPTK